MSYQMKEVRQGELSYDSPYKQNLKRNDRDELIYKTETLTDLESNSMVVWGPGDEEKE